MDDQSQKPADQQAVTPQLNNSPPDPPASQFARPTEAVFQDVRYPSPRPIQRPVQRTPRPPAATFNPSPTNPAPSLRDNYRRPTSPPVNSYQQPTKPMVSPNNYPAPVNIYQPPANPTASPNNNYQPPPNPSAIPNNYQRPASPPASTYQPPANPTAGPNNYPAAMPGPNNQAGLNNNVKKPRKRRTKAKLLVSGLLLIIVAIGCLKFFYNSGPALEAYTIGDANTASQSNPQYAVSFYQGANVEHKNSLAYLVASTPQTGQTAVWVSITASLSSCTVSGRLPFTFQYNSQPAPGCYAPSKKLYVAGVEYNQESYNISLSSQKPLSLNDAIDIFNSVEFAKTQ